MNWQPIVGTDHPLYAPTRKKLDEITQYFLERDDDELTKGGRFSLMGGAAGVAIYLCSYGNAFEHHDAFDKGLGLIEAIFGNIGSEAILDTHAGGLSGIGWTLEHFVQSGYIECDTNMVLEDCDQILSEAMIKNITVNDNWDFLHGALGNALYFLKRKSYPKAEAALKAYLDAFSTKAERDPKGGLKWRSVVFPKENETMWVYNFALAHGMAASIALLGKICKQYPKLTLAKELLMETFTYYQNHQHMHKESDQFYPSWIKAEESGEDGPSSRLAWCYGDPGIGSAFITAGRAANEKALIDHGLELIRNGIHKDDLKSAGVHDACVCHGSSSLSHMYNRAYQYSGEQVFKDAAIHWLDITHRMLQNDKFPLGYFIYHIDEYEFDTSMLEGISGMGLCLLAAITDQEPDWDECLLIS